MQKSEPEKNVVKMEVPFFQVPNSIFDADIKLVINKRKSKQKGEKETEVIERKMKAQEKLVYIYICRCSNNFSRAFPSYSKIAEKCGIGETTAKEIINTLISNGLLLKHSRYKPGSKEKDSNVYELLQVPSTLRDRPNTPGDQQSSTPRERPNTPGDQYKELDIKNYIKKELYINIVEYLNQKANTNYKATTKKTKDLINTRLNEGFTEEDFYTVIDKKTKEWAGTDMEKYIRPETLFGTKFESYLNQKVGGTRSGKDKTNNKINKQYNSNEKRGQGDTLAKRAKDIYGDKLEDFECDF